MFSPSTSRKRKALLRIKSDQSDKQTPNLFPASLETKVAMSTKLNRKASQEPESRCFPCSTSNPQEPNPEAQITSSKSLNLFPSTNPHLPAISIPPNKSITTGNKKEAHSELKNHELAQMNFFYAPITSLQYSNNKFNSNKFNSNKTISANNQ